MHGTLGHHKGLRGCGLQGTGFCQEQVVLNFNMPVGYWDLRANHKPLSVRGCPQNETGSACMCDPVWDKHCADIQPDRFRIIPLVSQLRISDLPPVDGKRESPPAVKGCDWAEQPRLQRAQPPTLISSFAGRRRVSFRSQRSHGKAGVQRALGLHRLPSSLIGVARGIKAPAVDYRVEEKAVLLQTGRDGLGDKGDYRPERGWEVCRRG